MDTAGSIRSFKLGITELQICNFFMQGVHGIMLIPTAGVIKNFILLGAAFVGQFARPLRQRLYVFVQGFF